MSRISFSEVAAVPDALDQVAFELLLGVVPLAGDSRHLTLKCQSVPIPGFSNERFTVNTHGHALNFRGRKMYPQTLAVQFYEDSNLDTLKALRIWHEYIAGTESNNSQDYRDGYTITAGLNVYDTTGAVAGTHAFEHFFPQDISDANLSGESSASVPISATFSYDRFIPNAVIL